MSVPLRAWARGRVTVEAGQGGTLITPRRIRLDYATAASNVALKNLSGVAAQGDLLWTVSDEGRTIECLRRYGDGYRLVSQTPVDDLFTDLPGRSSGKELDLESLDVADGRLWLCGSHCRVREKTVDQLSSRIDERRSRNLLGSVKLKKNGKFGRGQALTFAGKGGLRRHLQDHPFLAPFLPLPSKENGFDIEGFVNWEGRALVGLRGPVIDNVAVILDLAIADGLEITGSTTHFIALDGLGIRDLTRGRREIVILAGPVGAAGGPFRLHRWRPRRTEAIQHAPCVHAWPASPERPEGICCLDGDGEAGVLVLHDNPAERISGTHYEADWLPLQELAAP